MKATVHTKSAPFQPVEITISLESQVEVNQFYSIFNFCPVVDTMDSLDDDAIREALSDFEECAYSEHMKLNEAYRK